ncbi:hypothetical protein DSO57_1028131 [Entomophthora muscae]|uniref:Uncharacterized protein n=1 Tax=Entomophthora muscae TaxID=34485 RepID=A0ACC2RSF3_9FUNG|nr:hypothetical protein DSO57_1028131 [Entomophthora muscae]
MMTVYPILTALTGFQVSNLVPYLAKILPHFMGLYIRSQDRHIPPPDNQLTRCRRKPITPKVDLEILEKQGMLMPIRKTATTMGFAKSAVAATLQAHANFGSPPKKTPTGACVSTESDKAHYLVLAII